MVNLNDAIDIANKKTSNKNFKSVLELSDCFVMIQDDGDKYMICSQYRVDKTTGEFSVFNPLDIDDKEYKNGKLHKIQTKEST